MKKIAGLIAALISVCPLFSCPVGNTSAPELIQLGFLSGCNSWTSIRLGYEGDFVSDARMKKCNDDGRVDYCKQWTNSAVFTVNFLDRLDLYTVLGASKSKTDWRFENTSETTITRVELESQYNFLWAIGSRVILYEWCNLFLGIGGRYTSCKYQPNSFSLNGIDFSTAGSHFRYKEWQVHLDLSYKVHLLTPYIGIKYAETKVSLRDFATVISAKLTNANSFKNRFLIGLYLGCSLSTNQYAMLNLEGRFIDEEAVTVSCDFKF